jgi:uncharacterized membrane protein YgcG
VPAVSGGYLGAGRRPRRVPQRSAPKPVRRTVRIAPPRPEVSVRAPRPVRPRGRTVFAAPIARVSPVGRSPAQRSARANTQRRQYRQQIIATRQIQRAQQPPILAQPRQDVFRVQERQRKQQLADRRTQHIALQNVHLVQDQVANPRKEIPILYGQALAQLRQVNDIGRLTKNASNTRLPLEHRVGALRALRSRYGLPVSQQNFKAFRQAQAFHQFVHDGKEGDTFTVPLAVKPGKGLRQTAQTYQLRKQDRELVPVPVGRERTLTLGGYKDVYRPTISAHEAIRAESGGLARGFVQPSYAAVDAAHYGAKLIPEGKLGTPARKAVVEIAGVAPATVTGLYGLGAAGVAAATGDTKPIRAMAKSFSEDDPVGRLVTHGDFEGFAAHPGIALLEVAGGLKAAENIAGRFGRGGSLFRRGTPPPIRTRRGVPNVAGLDRQSRYSPGYVTSRVQVARDARTIRRFEQKRREAVDLARQSKAARDAGHTERATGLMKQAIDTAAEAERYNPARVRESASILQGPHRALVGDLERLGDVHEGTSQFAQRRGRGAIERELLGLKAARKEKRRPPVILRNEAEAEVQGLVAEGRVAPTRRELTKLADNLERQRPNLRNHEDVATNNQVVGAIREVLRTHPDDAALTQKFAAAARVYADLNRREHVSAEAVGAITPAEAEMSAAKPFAVAQMGARPNAEGKLAIGDHVLTLDEINTAQNAYAAAHPGALAAHERAFISHSSTISGPGAFNIRADKARGLSRARRTGAAVLYGTASVGRQAMIGSAVKLRNLTTQIESFRHMIRNAAARDLERHDPVSGATGIIHEDTAKAALDKYNHQATDPETGLAVPGFVPGVAVRINPFGGRPGQLEATLYDVDAEGFAPGEVHPIRDTILDALAGKDVGSGPWTVIPKPFVDRLVEHAGVSRGTSPFFRSLTSAFRHTVLPFSPTWLAGNAIESVGRAAIAGWHPGDSALEQRVISEWAKLGPRAADRFVLSIGRGHLGSVNQIGVRSTANSLGTGPLKVIREAAEAAMNAPKVGKPLGWGANMVGAYTRWMLDSVNGAMEGAIKGGMVGTEMRKLLPADLPAKSEAAIRYLAGELHSNPAAAEELLSRVQRAYGTYEHQTPGTRRLILNYTPFGAWLMNATNFLVHVLPADHPGLVSLAAAANSATLQYRREHGLDPTLAGEKSGGQRPPFLQGSIPSPAWYARLVGADPGAPIRLARYTPAGIATDPTSSLASAFLPQIPLNALQGTDFAGRPLRNKDGTPFDDSQRAGYFAGQLALSSIPIVGQAVRVGKKGPGALNPFQPTASRPPTKRRGSSGGRFGGLPGGSAGGGFGGLPGGSSTGGGGRFGGLPG